MTTPTFFPQDIIIKKRDGGALTKDEIEFFARGVADGKSFADYQATALLMAIFWRGMTPQETAWLTAQQINSQREYTSPNNRHASDHSETPYDKKPSLESSEICSVSITALPRHFQPLLKNLHPLN